MRTTKGLTPKGGERGGGFGLFGEIQARAVVFSPFSLLFFGEAFPLVFFSFVVKRGVRVAGEAREVAREGFNNHRANMRTRGREEEEEEEGRERE